MMNYLTPADLIAKGLRLPPLCVEPSVTPPGTRCAITGKPLERGYRVAEMVTGATAEFLDCFRGGVDGYVSEEAARCFKKSDPREGNPCARSFFVFEDGAAYLPLIARKAAQEQGRAAWCTRPVRACASGCGQGRACQPTIIFPASGGRLP